MKNKKLTICYFGTYRANYSRNQIMLTGLQVNDIEVIECHIPLWHSIEDRVQIATGQWASFSFASRLFTTYWQLLKKYYSLTQDYDVMVLGYPGQLDVILARLLTWVRGKPLALDLFMSIYLIAIERGLDKKSRLSIKLLWLLEAIICHLPNLLICDTQTYIQWYNRIYGVVTDKFRLVPTGVDDRIFHPIPLVANNSCRLFRVLYYGTYIPNHGIETILETAKILEHQPYIKFELIGTGPTKEKALYLAQLYSLSNVEFIDWLEKKHLIQKITNADILLGAFGTTPQSMMTVQNKIYEGLAMAKPLITGDSPTIREIFKHQQHLYLIERQNPSELAQAILALLANSELRDKLATFGYGLVKEKFATKSIGQKFRQHLEELRLN